MSELSDLTYDVLLKLWPWYTIFKEYYIKYKNTRLFFDFYIKELQLAIEVQGRQHSEFVKYFHGDREGFLKACRRDNLKKEYCDMNGIVLIEIYSKDDLDKDRLLSALFKKLKGANK